MEPHTIIHPGKIIKEDYLEEIGVSFSEAARRMKMYPAHLSAVLNGKRNITATLAKKLEAAGIGNAKTWLTYQMNYDLKYTPIPFDVEKVWDGKS